MSTQEPDSNNGEHGNEAKILSATNMKIALFHLKKTAGTSAYRHLREASKADLSANWSLDFEEAKSYAVLGGHYSINQITSLNSINICFLRNPVERVISLYNYVQTLSTIEVIRNGDAGATAMRSMTFESCLESIDRAVLYDVANNYCKNFFGENYKREEIFLDDCRFTDYAEAILKQINFFGFTETFQVSINGLMSFLGLSQPRKLHQEKNIQTLGKNINQVFEAEEIERLSKKIELLNSDDIQFYKNIFSRGPAQKASQPNEQVGDFPTMRAGCSFKFSGTVRSFANILYDGWYEVEDGVWSIGNTASLALLNAGDTSTILLELETPTYDDALIKTINVSINGDHNQRVHVVRSQTAVKIDHLAVSDYFVSAGETGRFIFSIPVKHISDTLLHIIISTDKITIPAKYYETGDDRMLGFKLHKLTAY